MKHKTELEKHIDRVRQHERQGKELKRDLENLMPIGTPVFYKTGNSGLLTGRIVQHYSHNGFVAENIETGGKTSVYFDFNFHGQP